MFGALLNFMVPYKANSSVPGTKVNCEVRETSAEVALSSQGWCWLGDRQIVPPSNSLLSLLGVHSLQSPKKSEMSCQLFASSLVDSSRLVAHFGLRVIKRTCHTGEKEAVECKV